MMRMKVGGGGTTFLPPWVEPSNLEAKNWGFSMIRSPISSVLYKKSNGTIGVYINSKQPKPQGPVYTSTSWKRWERFSLIAGSLCLFKKHLCKYGGTEHTPKICE